MAVSPLIMLVDDDETDLFVNEMIIKYSGVTDRFVLHKNGELAINYIKEHVGKPQGLPDVIFLDLNMPIMNGTAFLSHYEALPEHVTDNCKLVVLTSSNDHRDEASIKQNKHVVKYIQKPLSEEDLAVLD